MTAEEKSYIPITQQDATKLEAEGVAVMFDCKEAQGFFEAKEHGRQDVILIFRDDGCYIRAREDLVKSKDEIFVGFIEQGTPPEFEDIFEVREY